MSGNGGLLLAMTTLVAATALYGARQTLNLPGENRGFSPVQPIAFSHRLHAGELAIACRYCHTGAERSRVAGVPAESTCMKCHSKVVAAFSAERHPSGEGNGGTVAVSPELGKLYDDVGFDAAKLEYEPGHPTKPIEWIKVDRLPDFVRFDHRPHVHAGIRCQHCHGPVETMDKVEQWNEFNMGWCVNCHRDVTGGRVADVAQRPVSTDCSVCHY